MAKEAKRANGDTHAKQPIVNARSLILNTLERASPLELYRAPPVTNQATLMWKDIHARALPPQRLT
jgi:hypothetical protein